MSSIEEIKESIHNYLASSYAIELEYVAEKERIKQIDNFIREKLHMGEKWHKYYAWYSNWYSDKYKDFILEMLNYINERVDNIGETIKIFTTENIFNRFALIVGKEYKDVLFTNGGNIIFHIYIDDIDFDTRGDFDDAMELLEEIKEDHILKGHIQLSIKQRFYMKNDLSPIVL
jgi:hypothetical protein